MTESLPLRVGAARKEITPEPGVRLGGYVRRMQSSTGIHDALFARAVAMSERRRQLLILSLDLLGVDGRLCAAIRQGIAEATALRQAEIMVAATHTHAGPGAIFAEREGFDAHLTEEICRRATEAGIEAWSGRAPARLGAGCGGVEGVAANRVDPAGGTDTRVRVIRADSADGTPLATLVHFACHPTVLNHTNLLISAEFPGLATATLERATGAPVVFLNGAAGDVSTRYTRREATFAEAARLAGLLAQSALEVWHAALTSFSVSLGVANRVIWLPRRPRLSVAQIEQLRTDSERQYRDLLDQDSPPGDLRRVESFLEGIQVLDEAEGRDAEGPIEFEIQAMRINGMVLVGIPGELLSTTGRRIETGRASSDIAVVGYANGYVGYIPDSHGFHGETYESLVSPLAAGSDDSIVTAGISLIGQCIDGSRSPGRRSEEMGR